MAEFFDLNGMVEKDDDDVDMVVGDESRAEDEVVQVQEGAVGASDPKPQQVEGAKMNEEKAVADTQVAHSNLPLYIRRNYTLYQQLTRDDFNLTLPTFPGPLNKEDLFARWMELPSPRSNPVSGSWSRELGTPGSLSCPPAPMTGSQVFTFDTPLASVASSSTVVVSPPAPVTNITNATGDLDNNEGFLPYDGEDAEFIPNDDLPDAMMNGYLLPYFDDVFLGIDEVKEEVMDN